MANVVVSILAAAAIPTRLVGGVTKQKDGSISIEYSEPGQVKKVTRSFLPSEVVGFLSGDAGYVIAMLNSPITKVVGELVVKDGVRIVKTDAGNVALNQLPGVVFDVKEVEADSKEARAAERASRFKVRGAKRAEESKESSKSEKREAKSDRRDRGDRRDAKSERPARREAKEETRSERRSRR